MVFSGRKPAAPVVATAPAPAEAAHLSIVVLPFANLSGDPSQDYFADGITETSSPILSRIRNSFVIARNTAFTYKGKNSTPRRSARNSAFAMCSKVRCSAIESGRVNAQLIDAETGAHLWADRFEEDVADLFKLQDQVVARLANTLGYELVKAEAEKGARSKGPDAIDLVMRGWAIAAAVQPSRRRTTTLRREPCSNRRSRSTRTTPTRWRATLTPI